MRPWTFVLLAYGIVWCVILGYILRLRGRYRRAQRELALYRSEAREKAEKRL